MDMELAGWKIAKVSFNASPYNSPCSFYGDLMGMQALYSSCILQ